MNQSDNHNLQEPGARLIMLGTGSALVTRCYNTCFVLDARQGYMLVDAGGGNGILAQLEKVGIDFHELHYAFLTHGHTDHILGMIWVVRKIAQMVYAGDYEGTFTLYGHDEAVEMLHTFCRLAIPERFYKFVGSRLIFKVVSHGEQWDAVGCRFTAFDIGSTKTKQYGFNAILPDGRKLVCLGDEPYNTVSQDYAIDADWLLSEAFCLYEQHEVFKPYEKHHSTALDAGRDAAMLRAKNLLLYHTEDRNLATRQATYTAEAARNFGGRIVVPDDLQTIVL
ncbi:MAG: MBL fold metallo-hydrolase [Muribaculaceae bacterium]